MPAGVVVHLALGQGNVSVGALVAHGEHGAAGADQAEGCAGDGESTGAVDGQVVVSGQGAQMIDCPSGAGFL
jgi:hypothetical protein